LLPEYPLHVPLCNGDTANFHQKFGYGHVVKIDGNKLTIALRATAISIWRVLQNNPSGKSLGSLRDGLSSPFRKNILVFRNGESVLYPQPSRPTQRGVAQRHERGAGCGGR
jgi:hypothetical protein